MANEIELYTNPDYYSGEEVIAKLFVLGAQVGDDIEMAEVGVSGNFLADIPAELSEGTYTIQFYSDGEIISKGIINWSGTETTNIPVDEQDDIATRVDEKVKNTTDPLYNFHRIETSFKNKFSYLYDYATFNYFVKMNSSLRNILKTELNIPDEDDLNSLSIEGFSIEIIIDNILNNNNFVVFSEPISNF